MKIELTDQQERALKAGRPIEVADPETSRAFIILGLEQFERVHTLLEESAAPELAAPDAPAASVPDAVKPQRVRLRDLPTPEAVVEEANRLCQKYGWHRPDLEEQLKLQYYYGGQSIYVLPTPEGLVIIPIEEQYKDTPDLRQVLLTPDERSRAALDCPPPWQDAVSQILSS